MTSLEVKEPLTLKGTSVFDETLVAEFSPLIELDSSNGLSTVYRDSVDTTNSGSVTEDSGQFKVSTGSTASSTAGLRTKERGRYEPGIVGLPGVAIRRPAASTGNQELRWGYFDDTDGIFFGEDSTGIFVRIRNNSVDRDKVYQKDWNVDTLDGKGGTKNPSGLTLNLNKMVIYRIPFAWYGSGPVEMTALLTDPDNDEKPELVTVHRFTAKDDEILFQNPKLPVNVEADNGGDEKDISIFVGGRQFAVLGRYDPNRRQTPQENTASINTSETPLVTFRKKSDRKSQAKSGKVGGLGVASDTNAIITIFLDATLSGANFTDVSNIATSETAFEADTTATSLSGGTVIDKTIVSGGTGNTSNLAGIRNLGIDLPEETTVTLSARAISGTGTASAVFTIEEEW